MERDELDRIINAPEPKVIVNRDGSCTPVGESSMNLREALRDLAEKLPCKNWPGWKRGTKNPLTATPWKPCLSDDCIGCRIEAALAATPEQAPHCSARNAIGFECTEPQEHAGWHVARGVEGHAIECWQATAKPMPFNPIATSGPTAPAVEAGTGDAPSSCGCRKQVETAARMQPSPEVQQIILAIAQNLPSEAAALGSLSAHEVARVLVEMTEHIKWRDPDADGHFARLAERLNALR